MHQWACSEGCKRAEKEGRRRQEREQWYDNSNNFVCALWTPEAPLMSTRVSDVLDTSRLDIGSSRDSCSPSQSLSSSPTGSPGSGPSPDPSVLSSMPAYTVEVLCNSCMAQQQLDDSQSPMRKWALRRKNEPLETRVQRLERERTAKKNKRACETDDEKELRRLRDRKAKYIQRMQETEDQRTQRLQRDRDAMRLKRANETPEKRQARLRREREAKKIKRRLEKLDPALRTQSTTSPSWPLSQQT